MFSRPLPALTIIAALALAGCDEPMVRDGDVIRRAADPAYAYDKLGDVQAVSCNVSRPSGYSSVPSGCQRDVVFARQIARPADMIDPRRPGPAPAGPVGRAADAYAGAAGSANLAMAAATAPAGGRGTVIYPPAPVPADPYYGR